MNKPLGIIAGAGLFPWFVCREAVGQGFQCIVAAVAGEADEGFSFPGAVVEWFELSAIQDLISFFHRSGVQEAVFAGKINPRVIFEKRRLGSVLLKLISTGEDRSPSRLISLAIDYLAGKGIQIIEVDRFLSSCFCRPGILTKSVPDEIVNEDIRFGWNIARIVADQDIGQTVLVKEKTVIAVEGMEGTDAAILRAGELAGAGITAVKVCRSRQDSRIDLPAVGVETMTSLVHAKAAALCFQADKMPFFQKDEAIELADRHRIAVIARK